MLKIPRYNAVAVIYYSNLLVSAIFSGTSSCIKWLITDVSKYTFSFLPIVSPVLYILIITSEIIFCNKNSTKSRLSNACKVFLNRKQSNFRVPNSIVEICLRE